MLPMLSPVLLVLPVVPGPSLVVSTKASGAGDSSLMGFTRRSEGGLASACDRPRGELTKTDASTESSTVATASLLIHGAMKVPIVSSTSTSSIACGPPRPLPPRAPGPPPRRREEGAATAVMVVVASRTVSAARLCMVVILRHRRASASWPLVWRVSPLALTASLGVVQNAGLGHPLRFQYASRGSDKSDDGGSLKKASTHSHARRLSATSLSVPEGEEEEEEEEDDAEESESAASEVLSEVESLSRSLLSSLLLDDSSSSDAFTLVPLTAGRIVLGFAATTCSAVNASIDVYLYMPSPKTPPTGSAMRRSTPRGRLTAPAPPAPPARPLSSAARGFAPANMPSGKAKRTWRPRYPTRLSPCMPIGVVFSAEFAPKRPTFPRFA